ncbi:MAG: hypothetical protein ACKVOW_03275 [Chitinophagaceae bacterium]
MARIKGLEFFIIIGINIITGCEGKLDNPLSKETIRDIFGQVIDCKLVQMRDVGGIDIHGEIFLFYEYQLPKDEIATLIMNDAIVAYPKYSFGYFSTTTLIDSNYKSKWKRFPINNKMDSLLFQSTFSFLEISSLMDKIRKLDKDYFADSSNFYSYISAKSTGNCFFILVPKIDRLFLVIMTG